MFRRITAAASRLLKGESGSGQVSPEPGLYYPLEGLNNMVQSLVTTHPPLVLLWCQVLLIINYTNYSWWAEVHQTPRGHSLSCTKLLSPHSSGEGEEEKLESRLAMVNREIVRRGAVILFCDYVEWYVALVKSQCCLRGDVSLLETTELLTKLPAADLLSVMSCKKLLGHFLSHTSPSCHHLNPSHTGTNWVTCTVVVWRLLQNRLPLSVDLQWALYKCEWQACEIMAELVEGLQSILCLGHPRNAAFPIFLTPTLRNIIVSISRLPLVNSYTRVPPLVWKLGWSPQPGGEFGTTLPEIPVDFLQEKDVFREFLYRINTLGWSSRTQFEETWATLLGVLVTQPITMDQEEETQQEAITSLVLSAMTLPTAGNPAVSCLEQQPRNKSLKALETRFGRKLAVIRGEVEREIQALVSKRDNVSTHHPYHAWDPVPSLYANQP
ncbi:hypothetical protein XENOCAPTIV_007919 [Xenoophorus captivus]|uniref:Huntingtin n=1 Tax=Xenoophorus captivus TaxID=1517983 RepID=A0ABV0Q9E1_9TELE